MIVYSQNVNPWQYLLSTMKGFGLQANDIIKPFANLIERSIPDRSKGSPKFPYSPRELASELMKGPLCILFNTIFMTLHDKMKKNKFRYAVADSPSLAFKIWALANDWETLLIRDTDHRNTKQVLSAMIFWRETQNKMMRYLSKQNFSVSYMDVGRQSKKWENDKLNCESGKRPY